MSTEKLNSVNLSSSVFICGRNERAIALVITLLMLSVITFLAIAFLSMTRRDRSAVTATLDVDTAKSMSDAALARAQTEIVAQMMAQTDILSYDYTASHNYISQAGFFSGNTSATNVNYDYLSTGNSYYGSNNPADWAQNIGNLFYDPRPPVFVMVNGPNGTQSNDFRFWVDINRNGKFESNGYVQMLDGTGQFFTPSVSNFYNGEPEWIGVLKYPEYIHSPTNPFIGRYAFMALPIGKTLDLNFIHNYSKAIDFPSLLLNNPATQDGFVRDEGVGSWELNLAALLNDINTNMYPPSGSLLYTYVPGSGPNAGGAFDDAVQFIRFRYASTYNNNNNNNYPFSLNYMLGNPSPSEVSNIDELGLYPTTQYPFDYAGFPQISLNSPWPGTYNSNMFYDVQDLFDPTKTGSNNANLGGTFAYRFATNMTNLDSYDRYTMQRLLDCIGTSSAPEYGVYVYSNNVYSNLFVVSTNPTPGALPPPSWRRTKVNINYDNTAQIQAGPYSQTPAGPYGPFTPMPTNLVPWTPLGFFTNAADLLLRSQVFVYTNYVLVTNSVNGTPVVGYAPSNYILATFGITNIPVYNATNPGICYNEQVHRMLQLAANIYAAANPAYSSGSGQFRYQQPPAFRPQFSVSNAPSGPSNMFVTITNFVLVTNIANSNAFTQISKGFYDLTNYAAYTAATSGADPNFWGIPWVVGAVKGLPAFDQYSYNNQVRHARLLNFLRKPTSTPGQYSTGRPQFTNQFYEMSISNICGMDAWNPYSSNFYGSGNGLYVVASNVITITLTNNYNWSITNIATNTTGTSYSQPWTNVTSSTASYWPAGQFKIFLQTNFVALPNGYFSEFSTPRPQFVPFPTDGTQAFLPVDTNQTTFPTHYWSVTVTNHCVYALFDGPPGTGTLLDFVNLGPFGSSFPITQYLINNDQFSFPPYPAEWVVSPATDAGTSQISAGVTNQINSSVRSSIQFYESVQGNPGGYSATIGSFNAPGVAPAFGQQAISIAPYANYTDSNIWMACDPLVHYTIGDLTSPYPPSHTNQSVANPLFQLALSTGSVTARYTPWPGPTGGTTANNMLYIDPLVTSANAWQFPTNLFPGIGWLGRVHRGTPWQTIYLKSDNPNSEPNPTNDWTTWWVNSLYTYPTNDWSILDLFTAVPNDNAARGLLSVNQTNDAAWAAVFGGVIVITNSANGIPLNPTNDVYYLMDATNGINAARTNHPNGIFHHIGDILQASTLTMAPPEALAEPVYDEMVERIPQQTLSLLKLGLPQFVIYSWGQSLKPKNLYSSGSGNLLNICTNYEITGESLTRTVCHIVSDPGAGAPRIVIDNYNIMPGN